MRARLGDRRALQPANPQRVAPSARRDYGEHETSLALRMPKDRLAFWVSFLPDAYRTLRPDGIWLHDIPYWSNALSGQVGRTKRDLLVKFDPRDISRIFVQHPDGRFIEARARSLGFPAISLREWKQARKALRVKGRGERNDEQIIKTDYP